LALLSALLFLTTPPPSELSTLSLHDALPISANFQLNRNKIVHLYGDLDETGAERDDIQNRWFIGESIDRVWHYKTQGIWQQNERSEEHTSELQSRENLVCRLLLEKKKNKTKE